MTNKSAPTITRQLQTVFGVSIFLLLISSVASFYTNRMLIDTSKQVNHTNEVIITMDRLIATIRNAESGQRGYIITGEKEFLALYTGALDRAMTLLQELKNMTIDNAVQQKNLAKLTVLTDERFAQMERTKSRIDGLSQDQRAAIFINNSSDFAPGRRTMMDLQAMVDVIKNEELRLLKIRTEEQEFYTFYTPVVVVIAALLSILISVLAYFRIKADVDARNHKQREDQQLMEETGRRINVIESTTRRIAAGDYNACSEDTGDDDLGRISVALNEMGSVLNASFAELQAKNWLQEGAVRLSDAVRGEREVAAVANGSVQTIATYLQAAVGTLYMADAGMRLMLRGTYAAEGVPQEIGAGEGLMGQAIKDKKLLISRDLPGDYLRIKSSIGSTQPLYSAILPLLHDGEVLGVMEFGTFHEPGAQQIAFLNSTAESIAISLNAALSYERVQSLLEETQSQAEELQAQHSELENINMELELQSEKLQASEEELKVQQEELQQTNAELEERSRLLEERNQIISERNQEVLRQAEALAVSAKYKSEFMANMSHELRTPLNSILLLSRLLADNHQKTLSDEQVEYARIIQSSGNGLLALIDEILDLSKIEAGKMRLENEEVPLAEIASDMEALFQPVANEKNIDLYITLDDTLPDSITTDKMRLEQVLKNLLSNALKFTREGSVSLSIAKAPDKNDFIVFAVADTGIGIQEDKQQLIFEAFQQADGSTRRKYGGTGLGLSISKELSRLLGGSISVKSQVGTGSTFTITIPQIRPEVEREENIVQPKALLPDALPAADTENKYSNFVATSIPESIPDDRGNITSSDKVVLIIEDDIAFAKSLLDFTRSRGYKGVVSVRGDEGVELARQILPIGILLDIQLPIKSGWEVMEDIKANPHTRHIPVHIMSSHAVRKESLMKGAINFINKPLAFEQMQEVFSKLGHVLSRESKKVLIVEDNPKHASALAYYLGTANIASDIKQSIAESVEALQTDTDCVILDMGIPDANAYHTLEEIKKTPGLENLPIIVFTGKSLSLAEEQRIRKYADSIIVKTAHSYQRILDEVSLFLHVVEEGKGKSIQGSPDASAGLSEVLTGKSVLIVDDDVRNIFSLTKALESVKMRIITAVDGKDALEQLVANPNVDVVLLDMMMPQMDGYETARRIRENLGWQSLPIIAVTAKAMSGDRAKCIEAGASDYITKPIDVDQLLSLLRVWLHDSGGNKKNTGHAA